MRVWAGYRFLLRIIMLVSILAGIASVASANGLAAPSSAPSGPDRFSVVVVDYTKYTWWLIRWDEKEVECKIKVDHEGLPTPGDIYVDCGEEVYDKWITQKPCLASNTDECKGYYLILVDSEPAQKEIATML